MSDLDATADEMMGYTRGRRDERKRTVAALRKRADYLWSAYGEREENAVNELRDQADAIERGEL